MKAARLLQYSIVAAMAAVPMHANAFDLTPDTTQILSDPTYFGTKGQLGGASSFSYGAQSAEVENAAKVKTYSLTNDTGSFAQRLNYNFTDHLKVGVNMGYSSARRKNDYFVGADTKTKSNGFSDPSFYVLYRALDQKSAPVSIDLGASYAPDIIKAVGATTTGDSGSIARGGDALGLNMAVGREMKSLTVQGVLGATNYSQRTVEYSTGTTPNTTDAFWAPYVGVNTQTRLNDRFSVNANGGFTLNSNTSGTNIHGWDYKANQNNTTDLGLVLNYHIIPNRFVAQLSYDHYFYTDTTTKYIDQSHAASNGSTVNNDTDAFGVRFVYAFF